MNKKLVKEKVNYVSSDIFLLRIIEVNWLYSIENNSFELCVQFIHFEIPLQQKIDQIIHLNSEKRH